MQKTNIEYLAHTWNPIAMRCTPVSSGCENCWHLRMANRLSSIFEHFADLPHDNWYSDHEKCMAYMGEDILLKTDELSAPLRRKKPSVIGVNFMGDLFHERVANEMIAAVFGVMAACPQHTFIVLTKRLARALEWLGWINTDGSDWADGSEWANYHCVGRMQYAIGEIKTIAMKGDPWPLPNVWFGVSIEDQKTADERIPLLLQIPAAKRFVSAEPLLGEVELYTWLYPHGFNGPTHDARYNWNPGEPLIDWVICGAETGPKKRPMDLDWARSMRDQCAAASVPFFFKKDSDGNHTLDGVVYEDMPEGVTKCQK